MYTKNFKRCIDFMIASVALIILSPIFLITAVVLLINNKGTPFFYQERPGKDEKIFKIIKFKTMTDKKDAYGNLLPDKERLTKVGVFLRKTSIDEIPQLINIIKGDMSLIGPRPLLEAYLPYYTDVEKKRHNVRPGVTGLAQVNGRNLVKWDERLKLDVNYVENISFINDIKIFFLTVKKVLMRQDISVIASESGKRLDVERKSNED